MRLLAVSEVPRGPKYRVGITFNLKQKKENELEDEQAEYDSIHTIEAIGKAIGKTGCEAFSWKRGRSATEAEEAPDIVFNVAEGKGGRGREAQVPAILNLYSIPFTDPTRPPYVLHWIRGLRRKSKSRKIKRQCFCLERTCPSQEI